MDREKGFGMGAKNITGETMTTKKEVVKQLEDQLAECLYEDEDEAEWEAGTGVLITPNQAKKILELINS